MGSRSIGGSRVKKHAVSSDTKETTLRGQRPSRSKRGAVKSSRTWAGRSGSSPRSQETNVESGFRQGTAAILPDPSSRTLRSTRSIIMISSARNKSLLMSHSRTACATLDVVPDCAFVTLQFTGDLTLGVFPAPALCGPAEALAKRYSGAGSLAALAAAGDLEACWFPSKCSPLQVSLFSLLTFLQTEGDEIGYAGSAEDLIFDQVADTIAGSPTAHIPQCEPNELA